MSIFEDDYYRFTGVKNDCIFNKLKNLIFRHNLRFLYWLRRAEQGDFWGKCGAIVIQESMVLK